jgi:glycosyltransferase involved in cell wall biosynthesis
MNYQPSISIVIPTRNRLDSLHRALFAIQNQSHKPTEIIIVDASDIPLDGNLFDTNLKLLDIRIYHTHPSVCFQRNFGIEKSTSDYILLLDDDIELSKNYIELLLNHLESNKTETLCSGLILENSNGGWTYCEEKKSLIGIYMAAVFGLSVGFDCYESTLSDHFLSKFIIGNFKKNGNSLSRAGWPIMIDFRGPFFETPIYSLGATIIRTEKLKNVEFDTAFYENGVGENYDLLMSLNQKVGIINTAKAFHHKEKSNRLSAEQSYYYRIAALHYILLKHKRFTFMNLLCLIWSLIGNSILFLGKGKIRMLRYNFEIILRIIFNSPLYKSKK